MNKALLFAAAIAACSGPIAATATPALAQTVVAQQQMNQLGETYPSSFQEVIDMMHKEMASMKSTGNVDKDYMSTMKMLVHAMKMASQVEMKNGKSTQDKQTATDVYNRLFKTDPLDGIFGINR